MELFTPQGFAHYLALAFLAGSITWFNAWIKARVAKSQALKELRANPLCAVGKRLSSFKDASNSHLMGACTITGIRYGVVTLISDDGETLILTPQEYKAGFAFYHTPQEGLKYGEGK